MSEFSSVALESFKLDLIAQDIDVVSTVTHGCPALTVIAQASRERTNGVYSGMGLNEKFWKRGYTYSFKEYGDYPEFFTINNGGGYNSSATTIVFDSTAGLVVGSVLHNKTTGEMIRISAVGSATSTTVVRAFGSVAAASIADNETFTLVNVSTEFGEVGTSEVQVEAVDQSNYFSKITTTIKRTDLDNFASEPLYEMTLDNAQMTVAKFIDMKTQEHAKQIEKALILSQKKWDSVNEIGQMEGLIRLAIRGGINTDISTAPTLAAFIDAIRDTFKTGDPMTKYVFLGEECESVLTTMIELYNVEKHSINTWGLDGVNLTFKQIILPAGQTIRLVRHPYMTTESGYGGHALVIDPTVLDVVYMQGKDASGMPVKGTTRLEPVNTETNYARQQWDIVTYVTLGNKLASAHALVQLV